MNGQDYYDVVAEELQRKHIQPGLWTRAVAESGGEGDTARAFYIRLRVAELKAIDMRAGAEKARIEKEARDAKKRDRDGRHNLLITKCRGCGYAGAMDASFLPGADHVFFGTAVQCPKCKQRFDWYDHTS